MKIKLERADSPITLTLMMSEREARVLRTVCFHIAGALTGPRDVMDSLSLVLAANGIRPYDRRDIVTLTLPDTWAEIEETS